MVSTQKERRCRICDKQIAPARCRQFPTANTCGAAPCAKVMRSQQTRYEERYQPPLEGSAESADPHFRPRERKCSFCKETFITSAGWRMFCEWCRKSNAVRFAEPDRTYELSTSSRRSGGG